jgi:hypothetical protein
MFNLGIVKFKLGDSNFLSKSDVLYCLETTPKIFGGFSFKFFVGF